MTRKTSKKHTNRTSPVFYILLLLLICIFCYSAWQLGSYFLGSLEQKNKYDALSQLKDAAKQPASSSVSDVDGVLPEGTSPSGEESDEAVMLPEFEELYAMNSDLVGWLTIDGTVIDYPVMQTPDSPDFYLKRNFYKEHSEQGCLYAAEACDVATPSDNVTIYGHCMKDGSMFADLDSYLKKSFWEAHSTIQFDTLTDHRTYKIFAVFKTTASVGQGFTYHTMVDAVHPEEFNSFISQCKTLSFYDTGITPEYGDKVICLSTCEYTMENGRLVVAAVLED